MPNTDPGEIQHTGQGGRWGMWMPLPTGGKDSFVINTDMFGQRLYATADAKDALIRKLHILHSDLGRILKDYE